MRFGINSLARALTGPPGASFTLVGANFDGCLFNNNLDNRNGKTLDYYALVTKLVYYVYLQSFTHCYKHSKC